MRRSRAFVALFPLVIASPACAWQIHWGWLKRTVLDRIEISGSRTIGYHSYKVTGDAEAFRSLNYYGLGGKRWTDIGMLSFNGRQVGGFATFQATVDTNRFRDPNAQRVTLEYDEKPVKLQLGDIQGSLLNTNRFASMNKTLKGASAEFRSGSVRMKGIYSQAKGSAQTISFTGNNTSGPYYLNASQIVPGSEAVEVDGVRLKLLDDYVIRYEYGELSFVNRTIAPTSTIVVSYESFGVNSNRGTIQGLSSSVDMGRAGRIGFTAMRQITGSGTSLSSRHELFQGAGAASTPYFLELEPLRTRPIRVLLNGVEQVENVHYHFDSQNPTIFFFNFFVPTTATIEVVYTPKPTTTVNGDREVLGVDYSLSLGHGSSLLEPNGAVIDRKRRLDGGEVRLYAAQGKLKNDASPSKGVARGAEARYRIGDTQLRASWRDIPDGFVGIETRGFNRNEKAYEIGAAYARDGLSVDLNGNHSDVSIRTTNTSGGTVFSDASTTRASASIGYNKIVGEPWRLDLSSIRSTVVAGKTNLNAATLSTSRQFGPLQLKLNLENQSGRGLLQDGSTLAEKSIGLNTIRLESTYVPDSKWSINGRAGVSAVRAGSDSGTGKDFALNVNFDPSSRLNLGVTYALSDAGELALLSGLQTGYGLGYNGNGFSGGLNSPFQPGVTNLKLLNMHARYDMNDRVSWVATAERAETTGSYSSNSETTRFDVGLDWNLGASTAFNVNLNRSDTKFKESPITSGATSFNVNLASRPGKRWTMGLSSSYLLTEGATDFNQDNFSLDANLGYLIDGRQRLFGAYRTGRTTGFLPQDDTGFEFGYSYRIWREFALVGSYRLRDVRNKDGSTSGQYRARGFDIELRLGF